MNYKLLAMVFFSLVSILGVLYAVDNQENEVSQARADVIVIDSMNVFGKLERPGVPFLHDKHTRVLEKQGKDCSSCHLTESNQMVYKFKRIADVDRETTLEVYHDNCIGCHEETAAMDQNSGPVECGECHSQSPTVTVARELPDFYKSLHYKHIETLNAECQACHHDYDQTSNKIAYTKGEEQSCRTCHKKEPSESTASYQAVSHQSCVGCHQAARKQNPQKAANASVQCASCHDETSLSAIVKRENIPRLDRNQPDFTFVKTLHDNLDGMMNPVLFNHKFHEENVDSCSTCHHETLNSCESCHTLSGSEEGNWVTLAQAMHDIDAEQSCLGCHSQVKQQKDCKGCHALMKAEDTMADNQSCRSCHSLSIEKLKSVQKAGLTLTPERFASSPRTNVTVDYSSLPENLVIDVISDKYQGVHFPHRAIVESMMERIQGSALASNFHQGKEAICQSCHHNGPETYDPPPTCVSCHSSAQESKDSAIPGTKAAYHRQCFECHEAMEIEHPASTDCVGCHKKK